MLLWMSGEVWYSDWLASKLKKMAKRWRGSFGVMERSCNIVRLVLITEQERQGLRYPHCLGDLVAPARRSN